MYKIKKDRKDDLVLHIREIIKSEYLKHGTIGEIAISSIKVENVNLCSTDIYGFNFNGNNYGTKCINIGVYFNLKEDNPPLLVESLSPGDSDKVRVIRGYDYYKTSSNTTIKLSNFIKNNPDWNDISDWMEKSSIREKCKYIAHSDQTKECKFSRPDGKEYILDIPDEAPINIWTKSMEESLTTRYYRDLTLDDLYDIKRDQITWIDGLWFTYDYKDGLVELFKISDYKTNLISKKAFDLGIINKELNNDIIIKEIEKSLFERHDRELKVSKIDIIFLERDEIKI